MKAKIDYLYDVILPLYFIGSAITIAYITAAFYNVFAG